jgi:hypothetical protein
VLFFFREAMKLLILYEHFKDTGHLPWENVFILIHSYRYSVCIVSLYNNTPSNTIVNAASDITYRPVIEADDTGRCTEYMNFNLLLF